MGLTTFLVQLVFTLRVKLWKVVMICDVLSFWALFLKMYSYNSMYNSVSLWQYVYIRFMFFDKVFFSLPTVAMITENVSFSSFHCSHCKGNKFFHHNHAPYQSKLSLKKIDSNRQGMLKKIAVKVYPTTLPYC